MRIALLHYTKPPVIGGVERVIADQAQALRELGHEVVVMDAKEWKVATNASAQPASTAPAIKSEGVQPLQSAPAIGRVGVQPEKSAQAFRSAGFQPVYGLGASSPQFPAQFLNPEAEIKKTLHRLPHWQQSGATYFLTWRLADGIPHAKITELSSDRHHWLKNHPKPWSASEETEYHDRFGQPLDDLLDAGLGECLLAEPDAAKIVSESLRFFHGQRYDLGCFVIMPNHVHVVVTMRAGHELDATVHSWKSFTANKINRLLQRHGPVWQDGYYDRLIRSEEHLRFCVGYIAANPKKAKLDQDRYLVGGALLGDRGLEGPQPNTGWKPAPPEDFEAILAHNIFTMPFDLPWTAELHALAAAHPEIRWINWIHDVAAVNPHYAHLDWDSEDLKRLSLPPPNTVNVAVSAVRQQDYARATGLDPAQIQVIPNGIDPMRILGLTQRIAAAADAGDWWESDVILVHPARILRRKNLEMAIHVTAHLKSQGLAPRYLVTGAPDPHQADGAAYFKELQDLIQTLDLPAEVTFLAAEGEPLTDDDVRSLYALGDALFFPSTGEGFGLPLLEAAIHRLPIWCSDLPVHREVLGEAAQFFPADGDPATIATSLRDWIATDRGFQLRKKIWRAASWRQLCKERLEPLLTIGIEKT